MTRPLLSAAIIVRDEADHLRRCLASIRDVCDEIVVVDTGSVDDSVDVAASFGAVLGYYAWDDDFAAARNHALGLATGQWVLYIDADEELAVDADVGRSLLAGAQDVVAATIWFRTHPNFSPYREYRLWRHRDDIRFVGRIHETVVPDILAVVEREGMSVVEVDEFRLTHHGYTGDQTAKHRRNLPILERRVEEYPDRCYLWDHLATVRTALGDRDGALEAWETGVGLIRARGLRDRPDVLVYGGLATRLINDGVDASDLIAEAREVMPDYRTLDWLEASNEIRQGRRESAVEPLERLISTGPDSLDPSLAYHNGMFTDWAWSALGEVYLELGDVAAAARVFRDASAIRPDDRELRTKAAALTARVRRSSAPPG